MKQEQWIVIYLVARIVRKKVRASIYTLHILIWTEKAISIVNSSSKKSKISKKSKRVAFLNKKEKKLSEILKII